jgi:hypothetical protein
VEIQPKDWNEKPGFLRQGRKKCAMSLPKKKAHAAAPQSNTCLPQLAVSTSSFAKMSKLLRMFFFFPWENSILERGS